MIVYYRLCSIPSTNPSPILQEDKFQLNKLCLKSFVKAFEDVNPEVVFLADFCGEREEEMVKQVCPFKHSFIPTNIGINETCLMQYEMALQQTEHKEILFQECDYLYIPGSGKTVLKAIQELGLVSPYDHLNFYRDKSIHSETCDIRLVGPKHWRTVERNTMTFGITKEIFDKNYEIFKNYGYLDNEVWKDLKAAGHALWVPIPSIATHMVKDWLAPSINWKKLWEEVFK